MRSGVLIARRIACFAFAQIIHSDFPPSNYLQTYTVAGDNEEYSFPLNDNAANGTCNLYRVCVRILIEK